MQTLVVLIFLGVCGLLLRAYLPSYYAEKGKNLATKEDIAQITEEIERVKSTHAAQLKTIEHQNALLLEELKGTHQLRLAAVDKRLQAHQDAFSRWRRIMANLNNSKEIGAIINECQEWWNNNCLYLSPEAREAFIKAYLAANMYQILREDRTDVKSIQDNVQMVTAAGDAIVSGVSLPSLGKTESSTVSASN